jgi:hypothetical protein
MKKIAVLLILFLAASGTFAQKKNGTVYNEHESIDKTRQLWKAFVAGDLTTYKSYFADSIALSQNGGQVRNIPNNNFGNNVNWWKENVENVAVKDDAPAYPDAIEYSGGGLWVQDWIVLSGTHRESGINIEVHLHNLYSFNKDGKVDMFVQYYNDDVFEEINNSALTRENGKIFINHPYIASVRKLANAYCNEDLQTMLKYYSPNARFSTMEHQWGESIDLETRKKGIQENFDASENIKLKQIGYPDCIFYDESNQYVVYSWWEFSFKNSATGKEYKLPMMLTHNFDDDGKIVFESAFYSTNHFQDE